MELERLPDRIAPAAMNLTVNALTDTGAGAGLFGDLRYCLDQAEIAGNAGSTITVQNGLQGTIALTKALPVISQNTTITGPPLNSNGQPVVFVQGNATAQTPYSIFQINPNIAATIDNLVIQGGFAQNGGGIYNQGKLNLSNDEIQDNQATAGGGGIFNGGGASLDLNVVILSGNTSQGSGGALENIGGTVTMETSQVNGNTAFSGGGGIYNLQANETTPAKITCYDDTEISGNSDDGLGGGVNNGQGATFIMYGGYIGYNFERGGMGGGLYNGAGGTVDLENGVLIEHNQASNFGGGMYLAGGAQNPSTTTLDGVTVQQNQLTGPAGKGVGVYQQNGATILPPTNLTDNDDPGGKPVQGG